MSNHRMLQRALGECIAKGLTFAAFRLPGQPVRLWAQHEPGTATVDSVELIDLEHAFLMAPYDLDRGRIPYVRADARLILDNGDTDLTVLQACQGSPPEQAPPPEPTAKEDFINMVERAQKACQLRRMSKVVVSRLKEAEIPPADWPALYTWALEDNPRTMVAMAHTPEHGLWMGASPERLVQLQEGHVRVDSIAATRPADAIPPRLSGWGAKELDEQQQVTNRVHATFARMDLANIVVKGPGVLRAGPVAHLHTTLDAELGGTLLPDLVLELHPTPAICGSPRPEARFFIETNEKRDRLLYTGFWGPWQNEGATALYVNLRCMYHRSGRTVLPVGAGITALSNPEMEWQETERKARTWLRALRTTDKGG